MATKEITGTINNITFRNSEGWAVFTVRTDEIYITSCTGVIPAIADIGHCVTCSGIWITNKYGRQLKCDKIQPVIDTKSNKGVERLLMLLPGVGKVKAKAAVKELGATPAWKTALECPSYFVSNYEKACEVREAAQTLIENYQAVTYLFGIGLTENQTNKIIKKYGSKAIAQVSENPYQLINDIDGFGFRIVDGIALRSGVKSDSEQRILACIVFCLDDNEKNQGNIWFHGKSLIHIVVEELTKSAIAQEVSAVVTNYGIVKKLIYRLASEEQIVVDKNKVYSKKLLLAEKTIERCLKMVTV